MRKLKENTWGVGEMTVNSWKNTMYRTWREFKSNEKKFWRVHWNTEYYWSHLGGDLQKLFVFLAKLRRALPLNPVGGRLTYKCCQSWHLWQWCEQFNAQEGSVVYDFVLSQINYLTYSSILLFYSFLIYSILFYSSFSILLSWKTF